MSDDVVGALQEGAAVDLPGGAPGEVWNGVLHALSRRTLDSAGRLVDLVGSARRLVAFGGGSHSRPWMHAKAELCELPVLRTPAPEAVVRGAAAFAGVAGGWWAAVEEAPHPPLEEVR